MSLLNMIMKMLHKSAQHEKHCMKKEAQIVDSCQITGRL